MFLKIQTLFVSLFYKSTLQLGLLFILLFLTSSLCAYYSYLSPLRYISFLLLFIGLFFLLIAMYTDISKSIASKYLSSFILLLLLVLYFSLRVILHRFDLSVGDPSDYFLAGVCSVRYQQDIGFFLPLTASISSIGYAVLGLKYAPFINILFQLTLIPLAYFIFKKLQFNTFISLFLVFILIVLPLNIWFSSTSFSDPIWQIVLLIFILLWTQIFTQNTLSHGNYVILILLVGIIPFLRGEAVLYFGLLSTFMLYYIWFKQPKKMPYVFFILLGILALGIHFSITIRSNYLVSMQFSRVLEDITAQQLIGLIYGIALILGFIIWLTYRFKSSFVRLPLAKIMTIFLLISKVLFVYIYIKHTQLSFLDMLWLNEYSFMVGNFHILLSLLMILGIILLYYKAYHGETLPLLLLIIYTLFYIPFVMQKVNFHDAHAFLFYWNRYYLSIILFIHIVALGFSLDFIYQKLKSVIDIKKQYLFLFIVLLCTLLVSSFSSKLYAIVLSEPHQQYAYKLAPWLKQRVQNKTLTVIYDKGVIYQQNKGHIGLNDLKYLTSRLFSIYKIQAKEYQKVSSAQLTQNITFKTDLNQRHYVLCLSDTPCAIENKNLHLVDTLLLPLSWREHFGLQTHAQKIHHGDISMSIRKNLNLHATLYKIENAFEVGKKLSFQGLHFDKKILGNTWKFLPHSGAYSTEKLATLTLPLQHQTDYTLTLKCAIMNASASTPRNLHIKINGTLLVTQEITSPYTRTLKIHISKRLLDKDTQHMKVSFSTSPKGAIILRDLLLQIDP